MMHSGTITVALRPCSNRLAAWAQVTRNSKKCPPKSRPTVLLRKKSSVNPKSSICCTTGTKISLRLTMKYDIYTTYS